MKVGKNLYQYRKELGLSQKDFAEKVGVSQAAINYWENGKRQPRLDQLRKISNSLNITLNILLEGCWLEYKEELIEELDITKELTVDEYEELKKKGIIDNLPDTVAEYNEGVRNRNAAHSQINANLENTLLRNFNKLNKNGKVEAINYTEYLTTKEEKKYTEKE